MTGLFFSGTLGGITVGTLLVGGLFDVVGFDLGLAFCAVATAVGGLAVLRRDDRDGRSTTEGRGA